MIVAYWIVAGVLAAAAVGAGALKLVRSKEQLREAGQAWTDDFPAVAIRMIGSAELLGAVGVIVPMATGILPVLSPVAAIGIALIQVGAFATHARRKETLMMFVNMGLFALAATTAVLGFFTLAA